MSKKCILLFLLLSNLNQINAQNLLTNPSFEEGIDGPSRLAANWENCGNKGYTPPDLHDSSDNKHYFKVRNKASHGDKFISLVIREDQSTECIYQELRVPLIPNNHYLFQLDLCKSEQFRPLKDLNGSEEISFDSGTDLELYGITASGEKHLLHVFSDIQKLSWTTLSYTFKATREYTSISLSPFYQFHRLLPYNGHVLIDNLILVAL